MLLEKKTIDLGRGYDAECRITVKPITVADEYILYFDDDGLRQWCLSQLGPNEGYARPLIEKYDRATLNLFASYLLNCENPQGFPWGDSLVAVWMKHPRTHGAAGIPRVWLRVNKHLADLNALSEDAVKNS